MHARRAANTCMYANNWRCNMHACTYVCGAANTGCGIGGDLPEKGRGSVQPPRPPSPPRDVDPAGWAMVTRTDTDDRGRTRTRTCAAGNTARRQGRAVQGMPAALTIRAGPWARDARVRVRPRCFDRRRCTALQVGDVGKAGRLRGGSRRRFKHLPYSLPPNTSVTKSAFLGARDPR